MRIDLNWEYYDSNSNWLKGEGNKFTDSDKPAQEIYDQLVKEFDVDNLWVELEEIEEWLAELKVNVDTGDFEEHQYLQVAIIPDDDNSGFHTDYDLFAIHPDDLEDYE